MKLLHTVGRFHIFMHFITIFIELKLNLEFTDIVFTKKKGDIR